MNALKESFYKATQGEGNLVFISGEAGIGKTRLLREVSVFAQSRGTQVLHGRCPALFRMDGVPPYVIWKEVIKDYLEVCTPEQLQRVIGYYPAEVAKLVPEVNQKLRTTPQSFSISPEQEQNRLFEAVSQFITNISRETSLLVVLDDLQWTDPSSLLLLHFLAQGMQKAPLLLLGAYRTEIDDKHPLTSVLAELNRERLPQEVHLKRMSLRDISEMIKNMLEREDVPEEFCEMVYDKARGNPFFAEEVVKSLKEEGIIYLEKGKWKLKEISTIEFPKSVRNIVESRFSRLDNEYQNFLTLASFVGNDFTLEAMAAITGIEENKLLEMMDGLVKTGFIKHTVLRGEDVCSFTDIIMRDVVHEEVGPYKRKKLHALVGEALEKVYAHNIDEHLGELALHFRESGDKEKALGYFLKAGEKARKIYANNEAASYFKCALELLEGKEGENQQKERVLEQLGDIERIGGKYPECMKHWSDALMLSTKLEEKEETATLHRKMARVLWDKMDDKDKAREHHEMALKILEAEPETIEKARLYEDMAHMLRRMGEMPKASSWAEKALALAERLNSPEVVALSCNEIGVQATLVGNLKKSTEYSNRALRIAIENNYLDIAVTAYERVAEALHFEEYEKRLENLEKGLELAKRIGDISNYSFSLYLVANEYVSRGELTKALALLDEALTLARKTGDLAYIPWFLLSIGDAYRMKGEWDKSEQYYKDAEESSRSQNEFQTITGVVSSLGMLHFSKEQYGEAKNYFEQAYKECERVGAKFGEIGISELLAWTLIELGELEKARSILDSIQKFAQEIEDKRTRILEMVLRGSLARAEKKWNDSFEFFDKSLKEAESIKTNIWDAYAFAILLREYARAYSERNQKGDKENALHLLERALEMFQKMGAKKDVEKVEAKIAFLETGKEVSKPMAVEPVSTGYEDLDKLLYGGITSNRAVVLTSPSCPERDQLIKSFIEAGVRKGEVAFYVTINPGSVKAFADEFQSNFYLFICNPEADAIIKDSRNIFKMKGVENLTSISIALASAIKQLDPSLKTPRRICLSLVSDILLQHRAVETRRWLTALMTKLKSEDFTILAIIDPQVHPSEELHAILGLFDGEINIFEKETEKGSGRYLKIKRMSDQKYLENEILLTKTA